MPNLVADIQQISTEGDILHVYCKIVSDNYWQCDCNIDVPVTIVNGTPSQINSTIATAVEAYVLANHGLVVGAGEKVVLLGGAV